MSSGNAQGIVKQTNYTLLASFLLCVHVTFENEEYYIFVTKFIQHFFMFF